MVSLKILFIIWQTRISFAKGCLCSASFLPMMWFQSQAHGICGRYANTLSNSAWLLRTGKGGCAGLQSILSVQLVTPVTRAVHFAWENLGSACQRCHPLKHPPSVGLHPSLTIYRSAVDVVDKGGPNRDVAQVTSVGTEWWH